MSRSDAPELPQPIDHEASTQSFAQLTRDMQAENAVGLALAAQLGQTPNELSLVLRTALFDATVGTLQPVGQYMIHMLSLTEHKMTLGLFNHIAYVDDHPLLYHHNAPALRVFVTSPADDPDAVYKQIEDAHDEMFGAWRALEQDLNKRAEPESILQQGMGVLLETPKPFADAVVRILAANNVTCTLSVGEPKIGHFVLLAYDNSYFVARQFGVEAISGS